MLIHRNLIHHFQIYPVVDYISIHDILKNSVNSPEISKNILSNEQHESITKNKTIKLEKAKSHILDLDGLNKLSKEHQNNPIIGYLNINSLRNKINDLRKICRKTQIHVLCIDETKLDESFPDAQFHIKGYQYPAFRKDRNKNGGGRIVYVKERLIAKRILEYENRNIEAICIEIFISKRKWCLAFAYRPPYNNNKATFFMELNKSLCNIARKYKNRLIIGDLNINFGNLKGGIYIATCLIYVILSCFLTL